MMSHDNPTQVSGKSAFLVMKFSAELGAAVAIAASTDAHKAKVFMLGVLLELRNRTKDEYESLEIHTCNDLVGGSVVFAAGLVPNENEADVTDVITIESVDLI